MTEPTVNSEVGPWGLVPVWVLTYSLSGAELATYIALRSFSGASLGAADLQDIFPRVSVIAERASITRRTAERAITKLRELGLLTSTRRHDGRGYVKGCHYYLVDLDPRPIMRSLTDETDGALTDEMDGASPTSSSEQYLTTEGDLQEETTPALRGGSPEGARADAQARPLRGKHLVGATPAEMTRRIIAMWTVVLTENGGHPPQLDSGGWDHEGDANARGKHPIGGAVKAWAEQGPRTAEEIDRVLTEVRTHAYAEAQSQAAAA